MDRERLCERDSEGVLKVVKLFRNSIYPGYWVACVPSSGWVLFPATPNGWEERRPVRGLDPLHMRAVPASLAAGTGFLESMEQLGELQVA